VTTIKETIPVPNPTTKEDLLDFIDLNGSENSSVFVPIYDNRDEYELRQSLKHSKLNPQSNCCAGP